MIIQEATSAPVFTSIGSAPSHFRIKASARAFKILSGFYSEPILAIPRELGANAWDSHVKAGNTGKMFEVHAPNSLEPWFSIRDFGTGMSPEDIENIYTTYFESTKTKDNDSDGCMGLGSKTPLYYTENFSVTSYYRGTKYVYNCYKDQTDVPSIMFVLKEPTKEHNGMEIKFGVKISDISMFVEKVQRAYEPFRFRPVITGATITYAPREYEFEGTNWAMRKSTDRYNRGGCRAFMGNYSYPVSYDAVRGYISENIKDSDVSNKLYTLLQNATFDFFFDIGDLEVAPNKEQLQYDGDHKTARAVCDRALVALKELRSQVDKQLEVPKTLWHAMALYVKYNSYNSSFATLRRIIGEISVVFNGVEVDSGNLSAEQAHVKMNLLVKDPVKGDHIPDKFTIGALNYRSGADKFVIREKGYYTVTEKGDFPIFLYTGEINLKKSRIRHFLKTKFPNGNIPDSMLVTDFSPGFKTFKAHCECLGIPNDALVHIESLPKPPRVPREAKTATTDEINYVNTAEIDVDESRGYRTSTSWWRKPQTFTGAGTYYYVDFFYSDQQWKGKTITDQMDAVLRFVKQKKIVPETLDVIWGINKKNQKLLKVGKWVNIMDLAEKAMTKHGAEIEQNLYLLTLTDSVNRLSNIRRIIGNTTLLTNLKDKDTIKRMKGVIELSSCIGKVPTDTKALAYVFGIKTKMHTSPDVDPSEFEKWVKERYFNVLSFVDQYSTNGAQLARLINFIDEKS
jgi:hypothetical protein